MNPVRQRRMGTDAKIDMEKAPVSLMSNFRYFASKIPLFISMRRTRAFVILEIVFSPALSILLCCYQGWANNFAHPAILKTIIELFYRVEHCLASFYSPVI